MAEVYRVLQEKGERRQKPGGEFGAFFGWWGGRRVLGRVVAAGLACYGAGLFDGRR
jgi:hypothetical protein